ncbi:MAG: multiheme c-type cytochrome [Candidatus Eisenbacteria bacterium]
MARRAAYMNAISAVDSASVLHLDCGDVVGAKGAMEELKSRYLFESYGFMNVDAINLGSSDLLLGQKWLFEQMAKTGIPIISANVYYFDTGERFLRPYVIKRISPKRFLGVEWGGLKVGIFGLVQTLGENQGLPFDREKDEHRLIIKDPAVVAREMVEELRPQVDLIVCLAHTGWLHGRDLARNVSGIDLVIVGNGANVKPKPYVVNNIPLVMPGDEGEFLGVIDLYLDENKRVVEREGMSKELDDSIEDDPVMADLVERYKLDLQQIGDEIVPATSQLDVQKFLGAEACGECHTPELRDWKGGGHAHALESLVETGRDFDPTCLKCHVTGYGLFNGFHSYEKTPTMINVQCESCHGPGSDHVRWARGEDVSDSDLEPGLKYLFAAIEDRCLDCHDSENDPDFDFAAARPIVDHSRIQEALREQQKMGR